MTGVLSLQEGFPTTYMRWKPGEERLGRIFGPLGNAHPAVDLPCIPCGEQLGGELEVTMLVLGCEADNRGETGWFAAPALIIHERCAARLR